MGRRKRDPGPEFSFTDLAVGGALTKRAVQYLSDSGLLPNDQGIRALKRTAIIGGFVSAGVPLLVAGRLAKAILENFNQYDGEAPSGLNHLATKLSSDEIDTIPVEADDYWYHRTLYKNLDIYPRGKAIPSDALIEIADMKFVFLWSKTVNGAEPVHMSQDPSPLIGWIEGLERGEESTRFVSIIEKLPPLECVFVHHERYQEWREAVQRFNSEAQSARDNAIGRLTVNISLAIRTALDRLADYRTGSAHRRPQN
ncbi:MAG: hypothetical protein HC900_03255 [Methylacidiphilales bacterium]|nr:hypothetical protein [Candidatus Methylacidiphilales bacterium]